MSTTRNMIFIVHDIVNMSEYNIQTSKWKNFEFNRDIENYDPTQIFAQIQSATNLKKIKAMVFTIMDLCFPTIAHAYEFRLKCSEFCKSNGILYFYIPVSSIIAFSVMSKAKVMVEEGEEIIISCPSSASSQIYSNLLIRKKDHYQVIRSQTDSDLSLSQEWKKKLLKNSNPKKVILMRLSPMDSAHFLLKCSHLFENALVIREESHFASIHNVIVEKVMHVLGDKITPYDVTIQCLSKIAVLMDENLL
uniref:Uncharacterized protein n=1 Tax=Panagrolaimus superbus TaxID=310955 RepID=A0A914YI68_9BILA